MVDPVIYLENVWFRYYRKQDYVIKGISYKFIGGNVYCLVGPIGCGKTTLLLLLSGLIEPDKGRIEICGEKASKVQRKLVGICFQNPDDQIFNITVRDEIAYTLNQLGTNVDGKVEKILGEFGLEKILNKKTMELSYGQKKILSLASVLVYDPKILLLDEPTANLPPSRKRTIVEKILKSRQEGKLVIVATHDLEFAKKICDKVLVIKNGRIFREGNKAIIDNGVLEED